MQAVWEEGTANEAANLAAQGRRYNGYAVLDARGLCPTGRHVPTSARRYLTTPSVDLTADNSSNKRGMSVRCLKD